MARRDELAEALTDAVATLREVAESLWDLFGGAEDAGTRTPEVAHAIGLVEGAAVALGVTPLELLDEYELLR
jgi:hypothetical protein